MEAVARLTLPPGVWERIARHAHAADPDEAVGLLGGTPDGRVAHVAPLPNLTTGGAFLADPRAQFEAERGCSRLKLSPVAVYHSHPGGTAMLSPTDRFFAHPSLVQLVIALSRDGRIDARAYRVNNGLHEVLLWIENRCDHLPKRSDRRDG